MIGNDNTKNKEVIELVDSININKKKSKGNRIQLYGMYNYAKNIIDDDKIFKIILGHAVDCLREFYSSSSYYYNTLYIKHKTLPEDEYLFFVLISLAEASKLNHDDFNLFFSEKDISFLVTYLSNAYWNKSAYKLVKIIYLKYKEYANVIIEAISDELAEFINSQTDREIDYIIELSGIIIDSIAHEQNGVVEFFEQFLLPIFKKLDYSVITVMILSDTILLYCKYCSLCTTRALEYFLKIFNLSMTLTKVSIIGLVGNLICQQKFTKTQSNPNLLTRLESSLCIDPSIKKCTFTQELEILALAFKSDSFLVIDSAIAVLNKPKVKAVASSNSNEFMSIMFPVVYRASKRFWRQEQRYKILILFKWLYALDKISFENYLVLYNAKRASNDNISVNDIENIENNKR